MNFPLQKPSFKTARELTETIGPPALKALIGWLIAADGYLLLKPAHKKDTAGNKIDDETKSFLTAKLTADMSPETLAQFSSFTQWQHLDGEKQSFSMIINLPLAEMFLLHGELQQQLRMQKGSQPEDAFPDHPAAGLVFNDVEDQLDNAIALLGGHPHPDSGARIDWLLRGSSGPHKKSA